MRFSNAAKSNTASSTKKAKLQKGKDAAEIEKLQRQKEYLKWIVERLRREHRKSEALINTLQKSKDAAETEHEKLRHENLKSKAKINTLQNSKIAMEIEMNNLRREKRTKNIENSFFAAPPFTQNLARPYFCGRNSYYDDSPAIL